MIETLKNKDIILKTTTSFYKGQIVEIYYYDSKAEWIKIQTYTNNYDKLAGPIVLVPVPTIQSIEFITFN